MKQLRMPIFRKRNNSKLLRKNHKCTARLTSNDGEESQKCREWRWINAAAAADVSAGDEDCEENQNKTSQIQSLRRLVPYCITTQTPLYYTYVHTIAFV